MKKSSNSLFLAIVMVFFSITSAFGVDVITTIPVGVPAYRVAITPDGLRALVTSPGLNTVTIIDLESNSIFDTLTLPGSVNAGLEIAITHDGNKALITNYTDKTLIVLDINTSSVEGVPIPIGVSASGITTLSNNRTLLIPNEGNCGVDLHCLSIFETNVPGDWINVSLVGNIPVNRGPRMAAVTPDGLTALIPNGGLSGEGMTVNVVEASSLDDWSTASVTNAINVGGQPSVAAITPDGDTALVTNANDGTISVLEASSSTEWSSASVVKTIPLGGAGIALTPDGKTALVIEGSGVQTLKAQSMDDWSAELVSGNFVPLSGSPNLISITPDGKKALVTQYHAGTVSILSLEPAISCVTTAEELQAVLTQAADNGRDDIIHIVQGIYKGNFEYSSLESYDLVIEGGFFPGCTDRVVDPANTELDGDNTGRVLTLDCSGVAVDLVVDGLTLQNGNAIGDFGGGLYISTGGGNTIVKDNRIMNNSSGRNGGGSYIIGNGSAITLSNNTISSNNALDGGGGGAVLSGLTNEGTVTLNGNFISENTARSYGGVAVRGEKEIILINNQVINNITQGGGGSISVGSSQKTTIANNVINYNSANGDGAGLFVNIQFFFQNALIDIINNTIVGNNNLGLGGGIYLSLENDNHTANIYNH